MSSISIFPHVFLGGENKGKSTPLPLPPTPPVCLSMLARCVGPQYTRPSVLESTWDFTKPMDAKLKGYLQSWKKVSPDNDGTPGLWCVSLILPSHLRQTFSIGG
ncbi:hypothetical protein V6N13_002850 [Hibiscus sabdariffa]